MRARLAAVVVLVATLALGMWLGGHSGSLPGPLRDFARDHDQAVIDAAAERIRDDYYRKVDHRDLADDAVHGMVKGLNDRFSNYFDPKEYAQFKQVSDAQFSGVGLGIQKVASGLRIVHVYPRSPASKAGLRTGDVIVRAGGTPLAGKPEGTATGLIKGKAGSSVALVVKRGARQFTRRVTRANVSIPVVSSRTVRRGGKDYAVIRLETFTKSGVHAEVYAAVRRALKRKVAGIVFDLRGNGGGLVDEARLVASGFLRDGKIVTTRGRSVPERVYRATGQPVAPTTPMVVLVDRGTASASEIVAGALQDRGRAKLVGTRTFGKGVFQEVVELREGGALDITVGQYFLPSGRNLGGKGTSTGAGLQPDVKVKDDPKTQRDEAVERAVATLAGPSRP